MYDVYEINWPETLSHSHQNHHGVIMISKLISRNGRTSRAADKRSVGLAVTWEASESAHSALEVWRPQLGKHCRGVRATATVAALSSEEEASELNAALPWRRSHGITQRTLNLQTCKTQLGSDFKKLSTLCHENLQHGSKSTRQADASPPHITRAHKHTRFKAPLGCRHTGQTVHHWTSGKGLSASVWFVFAHSWWKWWVRVCLCL